MLVQWGLRFGIVHAYQVTGSAPPGRFISSSSLEGIHPISEEFTGYRSSIRMHSHFEEDTCHHYPTFHHPASIQLVP